MRRTRQGAPPPADPPAGTPRIRWRAVLIGGAVAVLVSLALSLIGMTLASDLLFLAATPVGLAAGGAVAGRLAGVFGAFQGGMVAVLWILAEALTDMVAPQAADVLGDIALVVLGDAGRIAIGALFGWLGERAKRARIRLRRSERDN
ncbi:MAG: hypothetical protein A3H36_09435 [Chloroflexi bacterium RIFCSPLOWO2_02_FULL_71_16]|nr:MAG: hypothetical protein A3H36_09435 [Chloroflexi bacterium RIFCSPLOWO2_02_FULL_71_16]